MMAFIQGYNWHKQTFHDQGHCTKVKCQGCLKLLCCKPYMVRSYTILMLRMYKNKLLSSRSHIHGQGQRCLKMPSCTILFGNELLHQVLKWLKWMQAENWHGQLFQLSSSHLQNQRSRMLRDTMFLNLIR